MVYRKKRYTPKKRFTKRGGFKKKALKPDGAFSRKIVQNFDLSVSATVADVA